MNPPVALFWKPKAESIKTQCYRSCTFKMCGFLIRIIYLHMLEDFGKPVETESSVKITRVSFCVVLALPISICLYFLFNPGIERELKEMAMLLGIIMWFISLVLTAIGTVAYFRSAGDKNSRRFWAIATCISASPIVVPILLMIIVL